jgi:hypothetical protein
MNEILFLELMRTNFPISGSAVAITAKDSILIRIIKFYRHSPCLIPCSVAGSICSLEMVKNQKLKTRFSTTHTSRTVHIQKRAFQAIPNRFVNIASFECAYLFFVCLIIIVTSGFYFLSFHGITIAKLFSSPSLCASLFCIFVGHVSPLTLFLNLLFWFGCFGLRSQIKLYSSNDFTIQRTEIVIRAFFQRFVKVVRDTKVSCFHNYILAPQQYYVKYRGGIS